MLQKKIILCLAGGTALIVVGAGTLEPFRLCGESWRSCMDMNYTLDLVLQPVVPFFIFALITYFLREEVYKAWVRVALCWLVVSVIIIAITKDVPASGFGPQLSFGKADVALLSSLLMAVISVVVIGWKYFQLRK